jgi:hypothetical protein
MMSVVRDWPGYLAEIFRVTAPGGHVQLTEMSTVLTSGTGKLRNDSSLKVMERALQKHASLNHLDVKIGSKLSALVEAAGFHSVEEKVVEIPIGAWQPGKTGSRTCLIIDAILDKVGTMMLEHMSEEIGIQARSCMIEIRVPEDGVDLYIEKIRQELRDLRLQLSVRAYASFTCECLRADGMSRLRSPAVHGRHLQRDLIHQKGSENRLPRLRKGFKLYQRLVKRKSIVFIGYLHWYGGDQSEMKNISSENVEDMLTDQHC